LRRRRYGVESDVGKEDHCRSPEDPADAVLAERAGVLGNERNEVAGVEKYRARRDHQHDDADLDDDHDVVDRGRFLDADDEQDRDENRDDDRGQVEYGGDRPASREPDRRAGRGAERRRKLNTELPQQRDEIARPSHGDGGGAERVLEDQIPPDDPGDELAECGVGVGVRGTGDRHRRRELGVAQRRERADEACDHHRQHDGGARVRRGGLSGQHEDARAHHGAHAQQHEVGSAEHPRQGCAAAVLVFVEDAGDRLAHEDRHAPERALRAPALS
jgi:hypothetical protein